METKGRTTRGISAYYQHPLPVFEAKVKVCRSAGKYKYNYVLVYVETY